MRIPNKFNGYFSDGRRLYNDPITAATLASSAGTAGAVGAGAAGIGAAGAGAAAAGAGALTTGLAAGAATAGGIFGGAGLGALGALAPTAGAVGGTGLGTLGTAGLGSAATTAGTTAALEGTKSAIISNAMQQQAMQNAIMQNMAGGIASPASQLAASAVNPAAIQAQGAKFLAQSQAAGMPIAGQQNLNFLNASLAGGNTAPVQMLPPKALAFQPEVTSAPWMNLTKEGAAIPGVTSNLPSTAAYGSTVSGPAIPGVTSELAAVPATTQIAQVPRGDFITDAFKFMGAPSWEGAKEYASEHPYATAAMGYGLYEALKPEQIKPPEQSKGMIRPYTYDYNPQTGAYATSPTADSSERRYFNPIFTAQEPYEAPGPEYKASGGLAAAYAVGGPVEQMAALNAVGMNTGYPMAGINTPMYANPMMQRPEAINVISPSGDAGVGAYSGEPKFAEGGETEVRGEYKYSYNPQTMQFTQLGVPERRVAIPNTGSGGGAWATPPQYKWEPIKDAGSQVSGGIMGAAAVPMKGRPASAPVNIPEYQTPEQRLGLGGFYDYMNQQLAGYGGYAGYAGGGVADLGSYSDGGRLLKGPGDGVSDSIPAVIGQRQPARLADGEFVVPARIVSEIGNGSTEAGARKLYAMMDRVQNARRKTTGKNKVAKDTKADKYLPA